MPACPVRLLHTKSLVRHTLQQSRISSALLLALPPSPAVFFLSHLHHPHLHVSHWSRDGLSQPYAHADNVPSTSRLIIKDRPATLLLSIVAGPRAARYFADSSLPPSAGPRCPILTTKKSHRPRCHYYCHCLLLPPWRARICNPPARTTIPTRATAPQSSRAAGRPMPLMSPPSARIPRTWIKKSRPHRRGCRPTSTFAPTQGTAATPPPP